MAHGIDTLILPELEEMKGRWGEPRLSPIVTASDIRRWAIATYWPETPPRQYWDEVYAAASVHRGIVAPLDFNPFAWPIDRTPPITLPFPKNVSLTGLNGGQIETYGSPQRPGDVIAERVRLREYHERQGRHGLTLHVIVEAEWTNQEASFVRRKVLTSILF